MLHPDYRAANNGSQRQGKGRQAGLVNAHISARSRKADVTLGPGGLRLRAPAYLGHGGGGKRGKCKGFSKASRRRLMDRLMMLDWASGASYLVTLTFRTPDVEAADAKNALRAWRQRLDRQYGERLGGVVWRQELQERGAIHYHLVLFWKGKAPQLHGFRCWNDAAWNAVAEPGDEVACRAGCNVKRTKNTSGQAVGKLMRYLSKYLGKVSEGDRELGRMWGIWGELPELALAYLTLSYHGFIGLTRRIRHWGGSSRYLAGVTVLWQGFSVYGDGYQLVQLLRGLQLEDADPGHYASVGLRQVQAGLPF